MVKVDFFCSYSFLQKSLYGLSAKISEMQDSAMEKRSELERLKRSRSISTILEFQVNFLIQYRSLVLLILNLTVYSGYA